MRDIIEKSFENQVKDLQELIRIPSVSRGENPEKCKFILSQIG